MTHSIGYFTGYSPQNCIPEILHQIQHIWGSRLEAMTYEQKIVFRAALAGYIAEKPVWHPNNNVSCIDCCIEGAGVDWDIWDADEALVKAIQECSQLDESDIEGLIEALTAQIRGKIYASRSV